MKRCDYCAKEITYHEIYCCDECQLATNRFYDKQEKFQKVFNVINGVFVLGIGIFLFLYPLLPDAAIFGIAGCLLILGVTYLLLPFPVDTMLRRFKLKKSVFITRIIAGVLLFLGVLALVLHFAGVV